MIKLFSFLSSNKEDHWNLVGVFVSTGSVHYSMCIVQQLTTTEPNYSKQRDVCVCVWRGKGGKQVWKAAYYISTQGLCVLMVFFTYGFL